MKNTYGVFCKKILGIKTNIPGFRWIYGAAPLTETEEAYKECVLKLQIIVTPERELSEIESCDKSFQSYMWDNKFKTIHCRRKLFGISIGYSIQLKDNEIIANVGTNYYRLIQHRTMNLHGAYYLLSDLANIMLLKSGYLTLYASAVSDKLTNTATVFFAPPNTGKTVTATKLCQKFGYLLVGEDVVITDGSYVYGCPWTNSYRTQGANFDSGGAILRKGREQKTKECEMSRLAELVSLSLGKYEVLTDKDELLRRIRILNGYLFSYYSSPIIKMLGYFDDRYDIPWEKQADIILSNMVDNCRCRCIEAENSMDFYKLLRIEEE